jgi:hypothetical protein
MFRRTSTLERLMLVAAGLLLVYPAGYADVAGVSLAAAALVLQRVLPRAREAAAR